MTATQSIDTETLTNIIIETMKIMPSAPFVCLPMSAVLYAKLRDEHNCKADLVTGNLFYGGDLLFKQDFSIEEAEPQKLKSWSGHAWVEIDGSICDLSFFRTLYSDGFDRPYKAALIDVLGTGRGAIVGTPEDMRQQGFTYQRIDQLKDETATAIIKGIEHLPIWKK